MPTGTIPTFEEFSQTYQPKQAAGIPTFEDFSANYISPDDPEIGKLDPFDGIVAAPKPAPPAPPAPPKYTGPPNLGSILTRTPPSPTHGGPQYGPSDIPKPAPMPGTPNDRFREAVHPRIFSTLADKILDDGGERSNAPSVEATGMPLDPAQTQALQVGQRKQEDTRVGLLKGAANLADGALEPQNLAIMAATGGLGILGPAGNVAQRLVSAGFSAQMLFEAYKNSPKVKAAFDSGDQAAASQALVELAGNLGMAAASAHHALTPGPATPFTARGMGFEEGNADPAPALPAALRVPPAPVGAPPAPEAIPPAQQSARVFEAAGPTPEEIRTNQEATYKRLFDEAEARNAKLQAKQSRQAPVVPETGVPQRVTEVQDARERLAQDLVKKPWSDVSNSERIAIDGLINEGRGLSAAPGEQPKPFNPERPMPGMPAPVEGRPEPSADEIRSKVSDIAATRGSFGMSLLRRETGARDEAIQPILDELVRNKTLAQANNRRGKVYHISRESEPGVTAISSQPTVEAAAASPPGASPAASAEPELKPEAVVNEPETAGTPVNKINAIPQKTEPQAATPEPPHEYSSTQVNLPADALAAHNAFAKSIPESELAEDGRDLAGHATLKYGLHADDPGELQKVLAGEPPIKAKIGKASIFPSNEGQEARGGAQYDVLKADVESPDLHRLNKKVADALPHTDTFPKYVPHVTIAYLRPGEGAKYVGKDIPGLTGKEISFDSVDFSGKDRTHTPIPLTGETGELPGVRGREATVYTPKETKLETQYRVVPADSLKTSFEENYPQVLQPRDANRVGSRQRIEETKSKLNPEKMGESVNAGDGAPIVLPGGEVVTRNHGTKAIQELYSEGHANGEAYKTWLRDNSSRFGIKPEDVDAVQNPVLVREAKGNPSPDSLKAFAEEANMSTTARMSDAERAQMLAGRIKGPVMDAYNPKEDGTPNPEFVQALMSGLSKEEQSALQDKNGQLSQSGIREVRNAIFAKAYPDSAAIERMAESSDDAVKNISNGMLAAAPKVARLQEAISRGDRHPLGIETEAAKAASVLEDLKSTGMTVDQWQKQGNLLGRDPVVDELVKVFAEHRRSAARIGDVLKEYSDIVEQLGDPKQEGLFGPTETPNKAEILDAANQLVKERAAEQTNAGKSGDLFGEAASSDSQAGANGPDQEQTGKPASSVIPPPPPRRRRQSQRGSISQKSIPSPSYDETQGKFVDGLNLDPDAKSQFEKSLAEWDKKNPERRVVTFNDIREEAKQYGADVVSQLTRPQSGETLNPAVRQAARDALAGIQDKITSMAQELANAKRVDDPKRYVDLASKMDALSRQKNNLIDVLIPTRSQDGRNLVYWRMEAQKSFSDEYWMARATKEAGGALPPETRTDLQEILDRGRAAEAEHGKDSSEAKAVRVELAKKMMHVQQSTPWEVITALRKMGLMGIKTHLRNIGGNLGFQLLEETSRLPSAAVDIALSLATGKRTVQGISPVAFAKATREAATRGIHEAAQTLKHGATLDQLGKSELHRELNSGSKLVDAWVNGNSRLLSAEDRVFKVLAYERSLQEQMKLSGLKQPNGAMEAQAIADADYATFNNKNVLSTAWNRGIASLNQGGLAGKTAALAAETVVPFVRTPTNIIARLFDYTPPGAAVRAAVPAIRALVNKELTPVQQRAISQAIGRGAVGTGLIGLGYMLAAKGHATGTSQFDAGARNVDEAAGRIPGAILFGDKWRSINQLSPEGNLVTIGATLYREGNRGLKNELKRPENLLKIASDTVMQEPLLEGANAAIEAVRQPGKQAQNYIGGVAGSFIPTVVAEVASAGDTKRRDIHATNLMDAVVKAAQMRTPGARNLLPVRKDVFGKTEDQNRVSAVDPTIGGTAKELYNPVLKEIEDRGLKLSKITEPKSQSVETTKGHQIVKGYQESPDEMQLRNDIQGALIYRGLSKVVQSPGYQALPTDRGDDTRRMVLEKVVERMRNPGSEGFSVSKLANNPRWGKLTKEQRIQKLQQILERVK